MNNLKKGFFNESPYALVKEVLKKSNFNSFYPCKSCLNVKWTIKKNAFFNGSPYALAKEVLKR